MFIVQLKRNFQRTMREKHYKHIDLSIRNPAGVISFIDNVLV